MTTSPGPSPTGFLNVDTPNDMSMLEPWEDVGFGVENIGVLYALASAQTPVSRVEYRIHLSLAAFAEPFPVGNPCVAAFLTKPNLLSRCIKETHRHGPFVLDIQTTQERHWVALG